MSNFNQIWSNHLKESDFDSSKLVINDTLNPKFWVKGQLKPEVTEKLMTIAQDFYELLKGEVPNIPNFEDVTFTGSLASYNYHSLSDIDLHILIDFQKIENESEILEKYFTAKRIQWNKEHKIMIYGHEVEIYIQDTNEEHIANGLYSVLKQDWLEMPVKERVDIDYESTKKKYDTISKEIRELSSMFGEKKYQEVYDYTIQLKDKIKRMRQSGLETGGPYSSENLAFKMLRINDDLQILSGLKVAAYDANLSINKKSGVKVSIQENWSKFLSEEGTI
jgi:hypothetical protein